LTQTIIKDGTGQGKAAKVDNKHRLATKTVSQSELISATQSGNAYTLSTGLINLTSGDESAVLYLKSNENSDLVVAKILTQVGLSNATGDIIRRDIIAPTTGTLITDATPALVANLNTGSSNSLDATVYVGAEGKTVGGGVFTGLSIWHQSQTIESDIGFIVPKGAVLGLSFEPPTGNTSLNIIIEVIVYLLDEV